MPRQRLWMLLWLGGAIAALMLLASGISALTFRPGHLYDLRGWLPLASSAGATPEIDPASIAFWQTVMAAISLALLLYLAVALIFSAELRRQLLRRIASIFGSVLLIYLFLGALRRIAAPLAGALSASTALTSPAGAVEPLPTFDPHPAPWLAIAISALLAALLLAGIWLVWRRARPRPAPFVRLADEAQAALADLQAGGDLADTVLRCYRDMSRILSDEQGIERPRAMTPREFERQLAAAGLRDEHIQQLTRLFERVRYGGRRADEREQRTAVACLTAIVRAYGRSP